MVAEHLSDGLKIIIIIIGNFCIGKQGTGFHVDHILRQKVRYGTKYDVVVTHGELTRDLFLVVGTHWSSLLPLILYSTTLYDCPITLQLVVNN